MLSILTKMRSWRSVRMANTCITLDRMGLGEGDLRRPRGLCVSGDYVYVTGDGNSCVSVFRTSGEFVHSFGKKGSGRGELKCPYGIAVDQDGFVFVCDPGNHHIQVF